MRIERIYQSVGPTKRQSYGQWADKTRQVVKSQEDVEDNEDGRLC